MSPISKSLAIRVYNNVAIGLSLTSIPCLVGMFAIEKVESRKVSRHWLYTTTNELRKSRKNSGLDEG